MYVGFIHEEQTVIFNSMKHMLNLLNIFLSGWYEKGKKRYEKRTVNLLRCLQENISYTFFRWKGVEKVVALEKMCLNGIKVNQLFFFNVGIKEIIDTFVKMFDRDVHK